MSYRNQNMADRARLEYLEQENRALKAQLGKYYKVTNEDLKSLAEGTPPMDMDGPQHIEIKGIALHDEETATPTKILATSDWPVPAIMMEGFIIGAIFVAISLLLFQLSH